MKQSLLFIIGNLGGGGAEKVLVDLLSNFDFSKYNIELCLITRSGIYLNDIPNEVKISYLHDNSKSFIYRFESRIYRHLKISIFEKLRIRGKTKKKYNSIISFLEGDPLKFHSYISHRTENNITWVHIDLLVNHNTAGYSFTKKHEIKAYENMNKIIFVSNDAMQQFNRRFTVNAKQLVIYNPILKDQIIYKAIAQTIPTNKTTICTVGRLCEQKALDRVIRVACILKSKGYDLDFWIIGDGNLKKPLEELVDKLNLNNSVHFIGFKKPPYSWMFAADIYLSTSITEGFPLVICEAICLGKPVVATKCTGPIEILDNDKYGILTEHDDESISSGIIRLLSNQELMNHYKIMAKKRAEMLFNIEKTMSQIYNILD